MKQEAVLDRKMPCSFAELAVVGDSKACNMLHQSVGVGILELVSCHSIQGESSDSNRVVVTIRSNR